MIHGGLRYLPMGDSALVREAASERKIVQAIAPHLARETPFVIPARNAGAPSPSCAPACGPSRSSAACRRAASTRSGRWPSSTASEPAIAARRPGRRGGLSGIPHRRRAADPGQCAQRRRARRAWSPTTRAVEAILTETAARSAVDRARDPARRVAARARLSARVIVNAAGPWVDAVRALEAPGATGRLTLTKGVHLVVPRERLPVTRTIIMPAADRRSVFAVPKGETTYIGTTDTFHPDAEVWPRDHRGGCRLPAGRRRRVVLGAAADPWPTSPRPGRACGRWWPRKASRPRTSRARTSSGPARPACSPSPAASSPPIAAWPSGWSTRSRTALGRKPAQCRTAKEPLPGGDVDVAAARARAGRGGASPETAARRVGLYGAEAARGGRRRGGRGGARGAARGRADAGGLLGAAQRPRLVRPRRRPSRRWTPAADGDGAAAGLVATPSASRQIDRCRALRRNALSQSARPSARREPDRMTSPIVDALRAALGEAAGAHRARRALDERRHDYWVVSHLRDRGGDRRRRARPASCGPRSVADVQATLRLANERRVAGHPVRPGQRRGRRRDRPRRTPSCSTCGA